MENEPKKRRGRPPGFKLTDEQKEAMRKGREEKRAQLEAEEAAAEARYEEVTGKKRPKGYKRQDPNDPWTAPQRRANKATWAAKRAEADKKKKALIAAQPNMTKQEMGLGNWKPADGSDSGYYGVALRNARVSLDLPPINIKNPEEVRQRIEQYFDFCEINNKPPNMIGLGNWLGVSTTTLTNWKNGNWSADHAVGPIIQRAMAVVEESLVSQVQDNPKAMVGGIFLLKSMFHYKEQQDIMISTGDQKHELTADDIAQRYLMDDKTVETSFVEGEE